VSESPVELPSAEELAVESATLFASLAFGRLAQESRDLQQARLAIDAVKALLGVVPEERRKDFESVVANLQLAYADAAAASE
jgi:hypothetical protein